MVVLEFLFKRGWGESVWLEGDCRGFVLKIYLNSKYIVFLLVFIRGDLGELMEMENKVVLNIVIVVI